MTRHRFAALAAAMVCWSVQGWASGEPSAPNTAYVAIKIALARSGPGMEHYPTDALPAGDQVEIIERRDEWVGVRPPEGSFSWVAAAGLQPIEPPLARVSDDNTSVWIGSSVSAVEQHEQQVHLRKGERVEILAEKTVEGPGGAATWLKIRPPIGELRWLRTSDLTDKSPDPPPAVAIEPKSPQPEDSKAKRKPTNPPSPRIRKETHDALVWVDRNGTRGSRNGGAAESDAVRADDDVVLEGRTFDDQITILQLKIARAAARSATLNEALRLEQDVERLVRTGASPYERGRASLLLENARELRALAKRRSEQVEPASFDIPPAEANPIDRGTVDVDATDGTPSAHQDGGYVASGWLMPVAANDRAAPPFVLMDEDGQPVAFVTPAPGLNLRRYVDKEVGVVGESSFPVLKRKHVVAHRVVELERLREADSEKPRPSVPWIRFRKSGE